MGLRQWCDAERRSRNARDASGDLVALVGLLRYLPSLGAVHEYDLCAMLAVGSEAPRATGAPAWVQPSWGAFTCVHNSPQCPERS